MNYDAILANARLLNGGTVDIAVSGTKIARISDAGTLSGPGRIDVGRGLCTRPLSDSHLHLDKAGTVQPAVPPPATIAQAIQTMAVVKREATKHPDRIVDRMLATLSSLHRHGTRVVRAVVDVDETWGLTGFNAALAARDRFGRMDVRIVAFAQEGMSDKVAALLREAADTGADVIGGHTDVDPDPRRHIKIAAQIAREANLPLEVHVDEAANADSFKLPVVLEESEGVSSLTLVHCLSLAKLPDREQDLWIERIKARRASVVVATSVLLFGLPLTSVVRMLEAGVPVGIGSDNLQDVFVPLGTGKLLETLRTIILVGRLNRFDLMERMLHGATGVGFRLVSGGSEEIEEGSPATLTVFSGESPAAVIFGEDDTRLSMVNGQIGETTR